jgi:NADH dehydrogenase (ubiquinone) 1 alpha subcomplex subunit 13
MATVRQEMPPPRGYPDIRIARDLPRRGPSGFVTIFGGIALMSLGFAVVVQTNKERRRVRKEHLNARLSLLPLLQAEEDRRILKALNAFHKEEALVMKDVPGWNVGESVYHTDKWIPPNVAELKFDDT